MLKILPCRLACRQPPGTCPVCGLLDWLFGLLVLGLQPILLGALLSDFRVTFDELALLATLEILAIGLGSVIAAFLFSTEFLARKICNPAGSLGHR